MLVLVYVLVYRLVIVVPSHPFGATANPSISPQNCVNDCFPYFRPLRWPRADCRIHSPF